MWYAVRTDPPSEAAQTILIVETTRQRLPVAVAQRDAGAWIVDGPTGAYTPRFAWWMPIPPVPEEIPHG